MLAQLFHPEVTSNNNYSVKPELSSNIQRLDYTYWLLKEIFSAVCFGFSCFKKFQPYCYWITETSPQNSTHYHAEVIVRLAVIFQLCIGISYQHMAFFSHISGQCASVHWKHMAWAYLTQWRELDTITWAEDPCVVEVQNSSDCIYYLMLQEKPVSKLPSMADVMFFGERFFFEGLGGVASCFKPDHLPRVESDHVFSC